MKKLYSYLLIAGIVAFAACTTSKKEDPAPSTTTKVSTTAKSSAKTSTQSTAKVSASRKKTSAATSKVRQGAKKARAERLALARMDTTGVPTMPDTTGFGSSFSGENFTSTGGNMPSDSLFEGLPAPPPGEDVNLGSDFNPNEQMGVDSSMTAEFGGDVDIKLGANNEITMTIDYGTGKDNPEYKNDTTAAKKLYGKMVLKITENGGRYVTDVTFTNYKEEYNNTSLNVTMNGSFKDASTFESDFSFKSSSDMNLTTTDASGTTKIVGESTISGSATEITDNSSLTITDGTSSFTYKTVKLVIKLDGCEKSYGLPVSGTATIVEGADTVVIDYGTGLCDTQATITVGDVSETVDLLAPEAAQ
ncbi:MAG: hypothetical protein SFY32_07440 [Bacteroidota bacterium]|nr:hypothetical protein [Bacteroidota bacterium]